MADKDIKQLKLGKGQTIFVKSQLKRLPREDETWEADFRSVPKPTAQTETLFLGMILTQPDGFLLADVEIDHLPNVNDLAKLLAMAMRRPWTNLPHRPRRIHLRENPCWNELFPHLKEIGVEIGISSELPKVNEACEEYLQQVRKSRSRGKISR